MGIDLKWKELLKDKFPLCFPNEIPLKSDIILVDTLIELRKWTHFAYTGEEIETRIIKGITELTKFNPEKIIYMIDEKEYVPKCKQATWDSRKEGKKLPYTLEEIQNQKIHIGNGPLPDIERVFFTPLLFEDLLLFFYQVIKKLHKSVKIGCTIIIDGCIKSSRLKKQRKGKPVNMDKPFPGCVIYFEKDIPKPIYFDSFKIGETDLKIVKNISLNHNKNFTIFSSDSDSIPILLLNMRDWIEKSTGFIKSNIYIDFGARSVKGLRYLSVVELYRQVCRFMISYRVERPIETMCILIIITGTDFVEKQNFVGPSTVLNVFINGGNDLFKLKKDDCIFKSDIEIGDTNLRHSIQIAEHLLKNFIQLCMPKAHQIKKKKLNNEPEKPILNLDSYLRRIFWNMDYWVNGELNFINPIELEKDTQLSMNGWIFDEKLKKVVPAPNVYKVVR